MSIAKPQKLFPVPFSFSLSQASLNWTNYNQNWINEGKCWRVKADKTEEKGK